MKLPLLLSTLIMLVTVGGVNVVTQARLGAKSHSLPNELPKNLVAVNSLEQSVHNQVNQYRQSKKLPPLVFDQTIAAQARTHTVAMANSGRVNHDGFDNRAAVIDRTISYSSVAENVASNKGYTNPDQQALKSWIKSPVHQRNMLGDFSLTGIGVVERGGSYYFTQIFIQKR
jgi:uncharacterized protein YkwD